MKINDRAIYDNLVRMIDEVQDYAIILLDTEGTILNWNKGAERIKGYEPSEIVGKNFSVFYTEADLTTKKHMSLLKLAESNGMASDNGWRVRKDGTLFWASITITSVHDENGNIIAFGKLTRDLTETRKAEHARELEIKNKELEQFTYIASHDLQEPLRTVSNYVQILEEDYSQVLDAQGNSYLRTIANASMRMRALVKALLGYSRLGQVKTKGPVDCTKILEDVLIDLNSLIKNQHAVIEIPVDMPVVVGTETELRQLFQNVISNAIKFTKKDHVPQIKIECKKDYAHWEFSIKDDGIGIEPESLERIFIIFQRTEIAREYEGYGIGLANCKKIVENHGGKIWVESKLGYGSTFYFTLIMN